MVCSKPPNIRKRLTSQPASKRCKLLEDFTNKYDDFIHKRDNQFEVKDLTAEELQDVCTDSKESAAGTDLCSPADFKKLPLVAFKWLANLLNLIELGCLWPDSLLHSRAA